jgi:hypothetical protein
MMLVPLNSRIKFSLALTACRIWEYATLVMVIGSAIVLERPDVRT